MRAIRLAFNLTCFLIRVVFVAPFASMRSAFEGYEEIDAESGPGYVMQLMAEREAEIRRIDDAISLPTIDAMDGATLVKGSAFACSDCGTIHRTTEGAQCSKCLSHSMFDLAEFVRRHETRAVTAADRKLLTFKKQRAGRRMTDEPCDMSGSEPTS